MNRDRGAVLVETAIVISLLLLLIMAVGEAGRYLAVWHGANTAAREGARYGVATGDSVNNIPRYTDCDEIRFAALALSGLADLDTADVAVTYVDADNNEVHACADGNPTAGDIPDGTRVKVEVTRNFDPITPLAGPFFGPVSVTEADSRTIFKESGA